MSSSPIWRSSETLRLRRRNKALSAILFLYKVVLDRPLERVEDVLRAKKPHRLPVVFTREEVRAVLARMQGDKAVMASLLYGSGLRLMEHLRFRRQGCRLRAEPHRRARRQGTIRCQCIIIASLASSR